MARVDNIASLMTAGDSTVNNRYQPLKQDDEESGDEVQ